MKTIGIFSDYQAYLPKVRYVVEFLNHHPLKPQGCSVFQVNPQDEPSISLSYGSKAQSDYIIPCQKLIFSDQVKSNDQLSIVEYGTEDFSAYSVESRSEKIKASFLSHRIFGFDIIETIFFHISRYEEYHCSDQKKDQWDMMWETDQLLVMHDLHRVPVVDHLVLSFYRAIGFDINQTDTTYSLSHDIDVIQKYQGVNRTLRSFARAILDNGISGFYNNLTLYINTKFNSAKDPFNTFSFLLIDRSSKVFIQKTLYLMSGGETNHDNYYQVNNHLIAEYIGLAKERGYHIGLHGSYNSAFKSSLFLEEKNRLEEVIRTPVVESRQHFLRYSFHHTSDIIEHSGIQKDSTLGYQRLIGFRCGTGFPYHLYSFKEKRAYRFLEQPMVIMDGALLQECAGNLDKAKDFLIEFQHQNRHNTHINYNVHNTIFDPVKRDIIKMKQIYELMLKTH